MPPPHLAALVSPVAAPASMWWLCGVGSQPATVSPAYNPGLVMVDLITPLKWVHIRLQARLGLREGGLAIWLLVKGFTASAPASVAPARGSGASS